jgi:hypothetical protein
LCEPAASFRPVCWLKTTNPAALVDRPDDAADGAFRTCPSSTGPVRAEGRSSITTGRMRWSSWVERLESGTSKRDRSQDRRPWSCLPCRSSSSASSSAFARDRTLGGCGSSVGPWTRSVSPPSSSYILTCRLLQIDADPFCFLFIRISHALMPSGSLLSPSPHSRVPSMYPV